MLTGAYCILVIATFFDSFWMWKTDEENDEKNEVNEEGEVNEESED